MLSVKDEITNPSVKIIVATHKKYEMPMDSIYLSLHVGAEGKIDSEGKPLDLGYTKDNTGDNISTKNSSYCELTGLYWAWKNLNEDYIGLVHYRRYFGIKTRGNQWIEGVYTNSEITAVIRQAKIVVPKKRRYFIETLYSHYKHTHYSNQLDVTRTIIEKLYPEYTSSFDTVIKHTYGYMFNMMIMRRDYLNEYCTWLFNILFELEKDIKVKDLSAFQGRFYGRVSEIIFNVWLDYKLKSGEIKKQDVKEIPYFHIEKVNWLKKGTSFLNAKFLGRKYEGSF